MIDIPTFVPPALLSDRPVETLLTFFVIILPIVGVPLLFFLLMSFLGYSEQLGEFGFAVVAGIGMLIGLFLGLKFYKIFWRWYPR